MTRRARLCGAARAVMVVIAATGCFLRSPSSPAPLSGPAQQLDAAIERARELAAEGHFLLVDSVFVRFAAAHPDTPSGAETIYWRAIFALDPSNTDSLRPDRVALLDRYLATKQPVSHRVEAGLLRELIATVDTLQSLATAYGHVPAGLSVGGASASIISVIERYAESQREVQRYKDELQKTKDELERLKKRLAPPPPSRS
jgi:hypothetical protein